MNLPHHKYIAAPDEWQACLKTLQSQPRLAIDLEANSMYAYRERVCLIQISTSSEDFIIDPLAPLDLSGLGQMISDSAVEKVFHAAEYDLMLLRRQYDWELNNLFDTMWAARILGYQRYGLASLLNQLYQVELDKRYQKSNWCKRPLSLAQRTYAQLDTHYLFRLQDHLTVELKKANRYEEAMETFVEQSRVKLSNNEFSPDSFWSINGVHDLSRQGQAVLKELNIYRDREARRRNKPHFKVFNNRTMLQLADRLPRDLHDLRQIHGMTSGQIQRHGPSLLRAIENGIKADPPPPAKRTKRPPDKVLSRYDRLHRWRKERAQERGVESDVIVSRDALWSIATENPRTLNEFDRLENIGDWRTKAYGEEILRILHKK